MFGLATIRSYSPRCSRHKLTIEIVAWVNCRASRQAIVCPSTQRLKLDIYTQRGTLVWCYNPTPASFCLRHEYAEINFPCRIECRASRIDVSSVAHSGFAVIAFRKTQNIFQTNCEKKTCKGRDRRNTHEPFDFYKSYLRGVNSVPLLAKPDPWNWRRSAPSNTFPVMTTTESTRTMFPHLFGGQNHRVWRRYHWKTGNSGGKKIKWE
jgi:hypothetical protein